MASGSDDAISNLNETDFQVRFQLTRAAMRRLQQSPTHLIESAAAQPYACTGAPTRRKSVQCCFLIGLVLV